MTLDTFKALTSIENVFTPFADSIQAFGERIREDQTGWRGFRGSITSSADSTPGHCENHVTMQCQIGLISNQQRYAIIFTIWKRMVGSMVTPGHYDRLEYTIAGGWMILDPALSCCNHPRTLARGLMTSCAA